MSRICLALTGASIEENLSYVKQYRKHIDMLELRADFLGPGEYGGIKNFPALAGGLPVILTFRKPQDGGHFRDEESSRFRLMKDALAGGFAFVDLEHDARAPEVEEAAAEAGTRIIRSMHNFEGVPGNLREWMEKLSSRPGEIPKMALMPESVKDLITLVRASRDFREYKEKIILGMGGWGFATRILAGALGSCLTFCSVPGGNAAPGHIDPETLDRLYDFRKITEKTKIYGIIGNPVFHTASPRLHNSAYRTLGMDAVYIPFLVDEVKDFFELAELLEIKGFSVTIPHKEAVISPLKETDEIVRVVGSCNTVYPLSGGWGGTNTDAPGFITPLLEQFGGSLEGRKAAVIGAGGAGKGVAFALKQAGCEVLVLNRTRSRAEALGEKLGCRGMGLDAEGLALLEEFNDIIVQTTNIGMTPDEDKDPVPDYEFHGHEVAYDIIYKPLETLFLKRAARRGCRIITGDQMLLHQGFRQFKIFTGKDYP